jgi:hypothetical protein
VDGGKKLDFGPPERASGQHGRSAKRGYFSEGYFDDLL